MRDLSGVHLVAQKPRLIFLLNTAQRHLQQWMAGRQAQLAEQLGATVPTPAQAGALFMLAISDGATMGELAQALDLEPPAVSGLVQRIEAMGWAERRPCPDDRRTQRVWLRPLGQALLPALREGTARTNQALATGFTDEELATVARWLEHVRRLPTPHEQEP